LKLTNGLILMMRKQFNLINDSVKRNCLGFVANLPTDEDTPLVVKIGESTRNLEQNALLWKLLECFSEQRQWVVNGEMVSLSSEDWKDLLTAAFRQETRMAQGLDGGVVMLGGRTSKMGKKEFSEFIEFIYASGAQIGVVFERWEA